MTTRTRKAKTPVIRELVGDEAVAGFDRQARRRLHMSGEDLLRRWDAGEFPDLEDPDAGWVGSLIHLAR